MSLVPRGSFFDLDRFFDNFGLSTTREESVSSGFFAPRIDILDQDKQYEITAEMPGVKKQDLQVTLNNGVLSIEAESKQENKEEQQGKLIRQERRYGKFMRSFNLGDNIQEDGVHASFNDGVLKLIVPKVITPPSQERRIEIN